MIPDVVVVGSHGAIGGGSKHEPPEPNAAGAARSRGLAAALAGCLALLLAGCATRVDSDWQDMRWTRSAQGPGDLAADREACMAEVVAGSTPTHLDRMTMQLQVQHNKLHRPEHMRVCMRDRGWEHDR